MERYAFRLGELILLLNVSCWDLLGKSSDLDCALLTGECWFDPEFERPKARVTELNQIVLQLLSLVLQQKTNQQNK